MPTALETKLLVRRLSRVKPWWTINFRIQFNERIFGRSEGSLLANFWDLWRVLETIGGTQQGCGDILPTVCDLI